MPQHLVVFQNSILTSGTLQAIPPVADPTVTIGGNDLYVPAKYNKILFVKGTVAAGTVSRQQLRSPSLREIFYPEVTPSVLISDTTGEHNFMNVSDSPIQLETNEGLNYFSDGGGDGTTAQNVWGAVILGDASPAPQKGKIFSLYGTTSIQATNSSWVSGAITFDQTLPVGTYDIVGLRAVAASMLAARLIFIGPSAITRPGVFGVKYNSVNLQPDFRMGNNGIYGTFNSITPPSMEILGGSSSSQDYIFDLVKRS